MLPHSVVQGSASSGLRCNRLTGPEWGNQEGVARTARAEARGVEAADSRLAGPAMLLPQGGRRLQWEDWIPGPWPQA